MKLTRNKNKRRDDNGDLKHAYKVKRICKVFSNYGMFGSRS